MSSITQATRAHSQRQCLRVCGRTSLLALMLLGAVACENDDGSESDATTDPVDSTEAGADGGSDEADSEADAALDGAPDDVDAEPDATPPEPDPGGSTTGMPCETAEECDDGVFCNGAERCVEDVNTGAKSCQPALRPYCPEGHLPCDEITRSCNCQDPDLDTDGEDAKVCGGNDCDDRDILCHSKAREICDDDDRDEDCDVTTFGNRDSDNDGVVDRQCRNRDPDTGEWHQGSDCDDQRDNVNPDAPELCDYYDNNCNDFIDERTYEDGTFEKANGGLMNDFMLDWDQDEQGDANSEIVRYCINDAPRRYILGSIPQDCDDNEASVFEGAPEICDGVDNDCDGLEDADDIQDLVEQYHFPGTTVVCIDGRWIIPEGGCPTDTRWCPERGDPIAQGCRTDATRLSSCQACNTNCQFSCGEEGCDEVIELALGDDHSCARTREGKMACWGRGANGRLGTDSDGQSTIPTSVLRIEGVSAIAAGAAHTCAAVGVEKALYCWGSNQNGQLGNDDTVGSSSVPVPVEGVGGTTIGIVGVKQIAAGNEHTCAVLESGQLICFGSRNDGRLADGGTSQGASLPINARRQQMIPGLPIPASVAVSDARQVVLGRAHGCALSTTGGVECWGSNENGQLGVDPATVASSSFLQKVAQLTGVSMLSAGLDHTCAVADGAVFCWGLNDFLQLGRPNTEDRSEDWLPKPVAGVTSAVSVSAGGYFSCATLGNGATHCWGSNASRQLGPTFEGAGSAVPIEYPRVDLTKLDAGRNHVCSVASNDRVLCWGANAYGQTGDTKTVMNTVEPAQILSLKSALR